MLSRPEPQSFTKFLVSLGVFLCLAAFVAPALVLRETKVLQVSRKSLAGLTVTGREEIERRQRVSRTVGHVVPYVGLAMLVGGIAVLVYATPRLRRQEAADEARAAAELQKLNAELTPQTAEDVAERTRQEAETVIASDHEAPSAASVPPPSQAAETVLYQATQQAERIRTIERQVLDRIRAIAPAEYELLAQVKVTSGGATPLLLDGVLRNKQRPDVVVDIRVSTGRFRVMSLRNRIDESVARLTRYRQRADPKARSWLIIVTDGEVQGDIGRRARDYSAELRELLTVTISDQAALDMLRFPDFED